MIPAEVAFLHAALTSERQLLELIVQRVPDAGQAAQARIDVALLLGAKLRGALERGSPEKVPVPARPPGSA